MEKHEQFRTSTAELPFIAGLEQDNSSKGAGGKGRAQCPQLCLFVALDAQWASTAAPEYACTQAWLSVGMQRGKAAQTAQWLMEHPVWQVNCVASELPCVASVLPCVASELHPCVVSELHPCVASELHLDPFTHLCLAGSSPPASKCVCQGRAGMRCTHGQQQGRMRQRSKSEPGPGSNFFLGPASPFSYSFS